MRNNDQLYELHLELEDILKELKSKEIEKSEQQDYEEGVLRGKTDMCEEIMELIGDTIELPKFKVGETVEALWATGNSTKHVILSIINTEHGYHYKWYDEENKCEFGLHEVFLSKCHA